MLLGVDVGGTFTDAVLIDRAGRLHSAKLPSTPADESIAVMRAVKLVLERARARPQEVERFAHGMTVATNAMLEGRTARTALIATAGFTDVIELARQARPYLYRLCRPGRRRWSPRSCASEPRSGSSPRASCARSRTARRVSSAGGSAPPRRRPWRSACCTPMPTRATSGCSGSSCVSSSPRRVCRSQASSSGPSASTSERPPRRSTRPSAAPGLIPRASVRAGGPDESRRPSSARNGQFKMPVGAR